jgi:hypothetical protein
MGTIVMSENDQPYSKSWESYSLESLNGGGTFHVEGHADWNKVFEELQPVCPQCGTSLFPKNVTRP